MRQTRLGTNTETQRRNEKQKQKNYLSPFLSNYNFYLSCNHLVSHWRCRLSTTLVPPVQAPCWFPVSNANILCSSVHFLSIYHSSGEPIVENSIQKPYGVPSYKFLHHMLRWSIKKIKYLFFFYHNISESTLCYCMSRDVSRSCSAVV